MYFERDFVGEQKQIRLLSIELNYDKILIFNMQNLQKAILKTLMNK